MMASEHASNAAPVRCDDWLVSVGSDSDDASNRELCGVGGVSSCIVADPPWDIDMDGGSTASRTPGIGWTNEKVRPLPYPTMSVEEIAALKVPAAKDAHCYIWTVNKYVEQTYGIARAWGFEPSCLLTWIKQPMGLGLGGTFASNTEFILFCRRGKLTAKRKLDTRWWGWPRGKHSAKPEAFQSIVESVSPGPYLEMFARRKRVGWMHFGNQITSDVRIEAGGGGGFENPSPAEKETNAEVSDEARLENLSAANSKQEKHE